MSDDLNPSAGVDPAVATEVTAPSESVQEQPVVDAGEQQPEQKRFTQEELDAAVGKRLARERRKWEREQQGHAVETQPAVQQQTLHIDQFQSPEAYASALAEQIANQRLVEREAAKQRESVVSDHFEREENAREKYADYDQVTRNRDLSITPTMAEVIQASDIGPEVAYHLGQNPKEAERISRLPPLLQAKEIGRIEDKLSSAPPVVKKTTSAPDPIRPIAASRTTQAPVTDTTDPRSVSTMSTSEWIEAERRRQAEKLRARQTR